MLSAVLFAPNWRTLHAISKSYLGFSQGEVVSGERKDLVVLHLEDVILSNATDLCPVRDNDHVLAFAIDAKQKVSPSASDFLAGVIFFRSH